MQLHTGHLRHAKCLHHGKQAVYWPELYNELQELANCQVFLKYSNNKHTKPASQQFGQEISLSSHGESLQLICLILKIPHNTSCGLLLLLSCDPQTRQHNHQVCHKQHANYLF